MARHVRQNGGRIVEKANACPEMELGPRNSYAEEATSVGGRAPMFYE
jgi:hypothetical protein